MALPNDIAICEGSKSNELKFAGIVLEGLV
jgi:hypothetical protein